MPLITVNTSEPLDFRAGDTVKWDRTWTKYPASTHALKYYFRRDSGDITKTVTGTANGNTFEIRLTDTQTAAFSPGIWLWYAQITETSTLDKLTVKDGTTTVEPSADADPEKTHAQLMIELIEAALEGRILRGHESTTINGQSISKIPLDTLKNMRELYRVERQNEQRNERVRRGQQSGLVGQVRFKL